LGEEYKAVLFLVEQKKEKRPVVFSVENMNHVFGKRKNSQAK
jgi:hypothetical protein